MSRSHAVVRLTLAAAAITVIVGCGIGAEDSPRDITTDQLPIDRPISAAVSGSGQRLWMIAPTIQGEETRLQAVSRNSAATPTELLNQLLAGVTLQERGDRISTSIPQNTQLIRAKLLTDGMLIVDLTDDFLKISGDLLVDAVAQIVFTASEFDGVGQVRLQIEGEPREWVRGNGTPTTEALTVYDFPEHAPTSQPDFPATPSPPADEPLTTG